MTFGLFPSCKLRDLDMIIVLIKVGNSVGNCFVGGRRKRPTFLIQTTIYLTLQILEIPYVPMRNNCHSNRAIMVNTLRTL